ncbi:MAG: sulfatase [Opitutaceae bacterium]|nr:sulfatase [Opitutaceae bacterium]
MNDWVFGGRPEIRTPNIDRLRAMGVSFVNAHCASPACHPSRIAVMTGVRPSTSGIDHNTYGRLTPSWRQGPNSGTGALEHAVVLSQHFRNHGYRAIGTGKIFHGLQWLDGSENEAADWDDYFPSAAEQIPFQPRPSDLVDDRESGIIGDRPIGGDTGRRGQVFGAHPLSIPDSEMSDFQVVDWALKQLNAPQQKPLFLAVGLFRPHMPWEVPPAYFDLYPLNKIRRPPIRENDLADTHGHNRTSWHRWVLANEEKFHMWERLIQGYQASITFADAQLGRLMDGLATSPLATNTVIVFWSDHGMHFGEKQNWEKFTLWNRSTHVPLIIVPPRGTNRGARVKSPASLIDLYPTLCELAGLPVPVQCEGTSLKPQLMDPLAPRTQPAVTTQTLGLQSGHSVTGERWHYIRYFDGFEELYDLENDPDEFTNVAADPRWASVKSSLLSQLKQTRAPLDGVYQRIDTGAVVGPPRTQAK